VARVEELAGPVRSLGPVARLPLFEIAFPAIKRRPRHKLRELLALTRALREAGEPDAVFEYTLTRLMRVQLSEAMRPRTAPAGGHARLRDHVGDLSVLFAVVAHFGHAQADAARRAYDESLRSLAPLAWTAFRLPEKWPAVLDAALARLDRLGPLVKPTVAEALARCVAHDGRLTVREAEMLRVICAQLHSPLPPLARWMPAA
jgi:hypothetical protein